METAMDKKPAAPKKIRKKRTDTPIADLIKYTPDLEKYCLESLLEDIFPQVCRVHLWCRNYLIVRWIANIKYSIFS